jgi:hypothetical protein
VALAVHKGSIAVVGGQYFDGSAPHKLAERLCRLGVGDAVGKHELYGPRIGTPIVAKSAAFSPDKKWLYLTGTYAELQRGKNGSDRNCLSQVKTDACRFRATLDSWTDPPTLWMCAYHPSWGRRGAYSPRLEVSRFRVDQKKVVLLERWNDVVQKKIKEWAPRVTTKRRMRVDPRTGLLYVESPGGKTPDGGAGTFDHLARIDPKTGEVNMVKLPFSAEDFPIDDWGHVYLRTGKLIGRFDLANMREIPFDYGERRSGRYYNSGDRAADLRSAIVMPGTRGPGWWEGGMDVNSLGQIVVSTANDGQRGDFKKSRPRIYPGRFICYEVHVFDKHGKILHEDAVRGVPETFGTFIDNQSNIYCLSSGPRIYPDGKAWLKGTGCVMKFRPGKGTFYASSGGAVPLSDRPVEKLPQLDHRPNRVFYVDGAEWIFPGAGFAPVKTSNAFPCQCWNMRFAVDHFGRSFVPEHRRDQVAVVDTNGNLVVQVGRYGNVDDGLPLHPWTDRRTQPPRSIGGDEVSLCYAHFVGTHSDRYLFIYDGMNDCIKSVKLAYHLDRLIPLKDVAEKARR